jgi:uncharacterized membrane protein
MNAKTILRDAFRTGITVKGFDGILEAIGGFLLWFVKPETLSRPIAALCQHELSRDPHDYIAMHILHVSEKIAHSDPFYASIFLLSHGVVKVGLATALWLDELWAYPVAIAIFSAFTIYQTYRYTHTHSNTLLVLTIFDVIVVALTWAEYNVQKAERAQPAESN